MEIYSLRVDENVRCVKWTGMRSHYNPEELAAALLLDYARAGGDVPLDVINRALVVLGDGVGL